jgi:hypothetical protein
MTINAWAFKVRDYTTTLVGQRFEFNDAFGGGVYFLVQRGDGTKYRYDEDRVTWSEKIGEIEVPDDKVGT